MTDQDMREKSLAVRRAKAEVRQAEVARLKGEGKRASEIAGELDEKVRTIYKDFAILKRRDRE